ncbi:MAG: flagellar M-ring protein FliF [Thermodesulfobacteriota bacterium]|nr:flagellar M-ring protein FliF [Thermodesulfobacteriota bacterium]
MNESLLQFVNFVKSLPVSKKISIAAAILLLTAAFAAMFMMANQVEYRVLFNNLSAQDAGAVITRLKEKNIPYKIEGGGSLIMVPAEQVYELRLGLMGDGLLKDGQVGFEIFDKTDFKTTQFVQGLNYQRALQGELARTIGSFKEVKNARVFIVLPKETLFVEDAKPASASILLDLKSSLPPERLAAIIHLTAGAVEGLDPEQVTVVDTKGRVIFKGGNKNETDTLLSNNQLDYKSKIEDETGKNVQSMLEGIIGPGNAIVRVNAEIDFNKTNLNEEEYDPSAAVVRSKRDAEESSQAGGNTTPEASTSAVNMRTGIVPAEAVIQNGKTKKESLTNYEINKVTRTVFIPAGTVKRLSVAAVIDGTYETEKMQDGTVKRKYIARTEDELKKFEDLVKSAMGYSEDREDLISVSSIPFSDAVSVENMMEADSSGFEYESFFRNYGKMILNIFLVAAVFFLLVRPLLNSLKNMSGEPAAGLRELPAGAPGNLRLPGSETQNRRERLLEISKSNPEKTEQLIKGWIGE